MFELSYEPPKVAVSEYVDERPEAGDLAGELARGLQGEAA